MAEKYVMKTNLTTWEVEIDDLDSTATTTRPPNTTAIVGSWPTWFWDLSAPIDEKPLGEIFRCVDPKDPSKPYPARKAARAAAAEPAYWNLMLTPKGRMFRITPEAYRLHAAKPYPEQQAEMAEWDRMFDEGRL
ncbi:hypothetical protein [Microbacterium sp. ZW T5_56]|uniref:hypothetical protein n=1 Tax=Microbacterium sp. ZW T5_56 TaxID=3378081 RepID=UPI0038520B77